MCVLVESWLRFCAILSLKMLSAFGSATAVPIAQLRPKAWCTPMGQALGLERRDLAMRYWWCSAFDDAWLFKLAPVAVLEEEESEDYMCLDVYSDDDSSDVSVGSKRKRYFE